MDEPPIVLVIKEHYIYKKKAQKKLTKDFIVVENGYSRDVCDITILEMLEEMKDSYFPQVIDCSQIVKEYDEEIQRKAEYMHCVTPELWNLTKWIGKNIIHTIKQDTSYKTVSVKIRIALGMLDKIEKSGKIDREMSLFYFHNIMVNCRDLWYAIHFNYLQTGGLPF